MADLISQSIVDLAARDELERQRKIKAAWENYDGIDTLPLTPAEDGDDNVRLNYGKLIVNKSVTWLFGADRGLGFSITNPDSDDSDENAEDELGKLWPQEERAVALQQMGVNGGVAGHNFVKLMAPDPAAITPKPRVIVLDPANMTVIWDQEDIGRVLEFRYQWNAIDTDTGKPYARRQRTIRIDNTERWIIVDERADEDSLDWTPITDEFEWAYDWCPIHHNQNLPAPNEFYGASDLEPDVLALIQALQAIAGYSRKLTRHRGHPLPYVTGEQAERIESLNVALGRLLVIPDPNANVGQLDAMTLDAVLDLYRELKIALFEVSRTPATAFGSSMSNIAEETVELSFAPAVEKTWDKRLTYGPMLTSLTSHVLELGGITERRPQPQWTEIVPRSSKSEAEALQRDLDMGIVSKATVAQKRGYDWDTEKGRIEDDRAESATRDPLANFLNAN